MILLIAEVPQRPIPQSTHQVCHGWTRVHRRRQFEKHLIFKTHYGTFSAETCGSEDAGFEQSSNLKDDTKKFADFEVSNLENVLKQLRDVMGNATRSTSSEMLDALKLAATVLER